MSEKLYFLDLSLWKRSFIKKFFPDNECIFISKQKFSVLVKKNQEIKNSLTAVFWASHLKNHECLKFYRYYRKHPYVKFIFLEDAFIRSLGLGSDFFYPYSIAVDRIGIYYNPAAPSTLELLIREIRKRPDYSELIERAKKLRKIIVDRHISKYYRCQERIFLSNVADLKAHIRNNETMGSYYEKIIFVPCQVDTDASVVTGGLGYDSLSLLRELRKQYPEACIIAKVHPDVLRGNRKNDSSISDYEKYANMVFTSEFTSLECIEVAEEVHTISSYSGFEALMRGKKVVCYGMPFYAGYGLTEDVSYMKEDPVAISTHMRRFDSSLTVDDIWAAAAILYPKYYNWDRGALSTPEEIAEIMASADKTKQSRFFQIRSWFLTNLFIRPYNWIMKKKTY